MQMLGAKQVADKIGYSKSELYRKIRSGGFPPGQRVMNTTRWADYIVDAWNILYWNLNEPLPEIAPETMEMIEECIAVAKNQKKYKTA